MKKVLILNLIIFLCCITNVNAEIRDNYLSNVNIYIDEIQSSKLKDNDYKTNEIITKGSTIKISTDSKMTGIYIIYNLSSTNGTINYKDGMIRIGQNGFLHEFVELSGQKEISLVYNNDVTIKEIFVFDSQIPKWVQKWQVPHDDVDLMLFATHSDDESIFFAGLIPTMINSNKKVQVVYGARHENTPIRFDELLNSLWVSGVKNYPIIGIMPDQYSQSLDGAINKLLNVNITTDDLIKFNVDLIRKFKPEVIVTHDENGEYGHGQHRLLCYTVKESLKYVNSKNYDSKYEPFNPYKVYLHLYKNNPIKMNYDIPLAKYDGQTAYRVSMNSLSEHSSQMRSKWRKWRDFTSAKEVKEHSPLYFGLYYSRVGYENKDNDMFYNIPIKIEEKEFKELKNDFIKDISEEHKKNNLDHLVIMAISILIIIIFMLIFIFLK